MQEYKIVPAPVSLQVDRLVLSNVHVKLFKEAYVYVDMFSGQKLIQQTAVVIPEEEYKQWKDDDTFILQCVTSKLGFALAPIEPSATEPPTAEPIETEEAQA